MPFSIPFFYFHLSQRSGLNNFFQRCQTLCFYYATLISKVINALNRLLHYVLFLTEGILFD